MASELKPGELKPGELQRYIERCQELAHGGEFSWWSRLAEILTMLSAAPVASEGEREPVAMELEALREFASEATKAITSLTGGGSEFFGRRVGDIYLADLAYCSKHIRGRMEGANERAVKAARDLRHWRDEVGKLQSRLAASPAEPEPTVGVKALEARCCSAISPCSWQRRHGMADVCPTCRAAALSTLKPAGERP